MQHRVITIMLLVGLCFGLITLGSAMSSWRLPDHEQGYSPEQPIDYSHHLHAGELGIDCLFCHSAAKRSRHAGIPSSDVCMKCHKYVTESFNVLTEKRSQERDKAKAENRKPELVKSVSPKLADFYEQLGLDENLKPKPGVEAKSIEWVRIHDLPDYVYFDHRAHVSAGVSCQRCHGPVESMKRVEQFASLSMGWCVNCHRDATKNGIDGRAVHASTDCAVCHY